MGMNGWEDGHPKNEARNVQRTSEYDDDIAPAYNAKKNGKGEEKKGVVVRRPMNGKKKNKIRKVIVLGKVTVSRKR